MEKEKAQEQPALKSKTDSGGEAQAMRVAVVIVIKSRKQAYHMHEDYFPV